VIVDVTPGAVTVAVCPAPTVTVDVAPWAVTVAVCPAPTVTVDVAPGAETVVVAVAETVVVAETVEVTAAAPPCTVSARRSPGTLVLPRPVLMVRTISSVPADVAPIAGATSSGPPM